MIPTASELQDKYSFREKYDFDSINYSAIEKYAIEFAKLHVKAALEAVIQSGYKLGEDLGNDWDMDDQTIIDAYPEENIK